MDPFTSPTDEASFEPSWVRKCGETIALVLSSFQEGQNQCTNRKRGKSGGSGHRFSLRTLAVLD